MQASAKPRRIRRVCGVEVPRVEDGRRSSAHKFRRLVKAYTSELGHDLSEVDRGLVAQAAALAVHIERLQRDILEGRDVSADEVVRLSSEHRRLLTALRSRAAKKPPPATSIAEAMARTGA